MKHEFTIDVNDVIDNGIEKIPFDPKHVEVTERHEEKPEWGNEACSYLVYTYKHPEIWKMCRFRDYSSNFNSFYMEHHSKLVKINTGKYGDEPCLVISVSVKTKFRKKRGKDEWTEKSYVEHAEKWEDLKQRHNKERAIEAFKHAVKAFNDHFENIQRDKAITALTNVGSWNFKSNVDYVKKVEGIDKSIAAFKKQIDALQEKINELRGIKLDMDYDHILEYIHSDKNDVHEDFVSDLADRVNELKKEGYKPSNRLVFPA